MKEADGAYILRRWLEQDEAVRGLVQNVSRHPGDLVSHGDHGHVFSLLLLTAAVASVVCAVWSSPLSRRRFPEKGQSGEL